jgi:hypothetical protein
MAGVETPETFCAKWSLGEKTPSRTKSLGSTLQPSRAILGVPPNPLIPQNMTPIEIVNYVKLAPVISKEPSSN